MSADNAPSRIEIRRNKVAGAARVLFALQGFHATGIAQIAESSGIRVQQIYRDFANKEAIVAVIVEHDVGQFFSEISDVGGQSSGGRPALRAWVKQLMLEVMSKKEHRLFLEIFAEASRNPRIAAILRPIDLKARAGLIEVFTAFGAPGADLTQLSVVADLFLSFIGGLNERRVVHDEMDSERLAEMMCDMVVEQIPM